MTKDYEQEFNSIYLATKDKSDKAWMAKVKMTVVRCLEAFDNPESEKYFLKVDGKIEFVNSKFFHSIIGAAASRKLAGVVGYERVLSQDSKNGKYAGQIMYAKKENSNGY